MSSEKKFNPSVGLFPAKSGNGYSVAISAKVLAELQAAEVGGRLYLSEVPEEKRGDNENFPHYRLTIFPPGDGKKPTPRKEENGSL